MIQRFAPLLLLVLFAGCVEPTYARQVTGANFVEMQRADLDCILREACKLPGWQTRINDIRLSLNSIPPNDVVAVDNVWLEFTTEAIRKAGGK